MTEKSILSIKPLKSNRDKIKVRPLMENHVIPSVGSTIFCGRTGSGKTNVIANLMKNKQLLQGYYDLVYVFCLSPCNMLLDNCKDIIEKRMFTDGDPKKLAKIIKTQKEIVKNDGFERAPKILFIMDDMISEPSFMNSRPLKELFFAGTHFKCSCFVTSQSYVKIPRSLRINCHFLLLFHGITESEINRFSAEHQPPQLKKNQFINMTE